jgi:hypothetical protein
LHNKISLITLIFLSGALGYTLASADWGPDVQLTFGQSYSHTTNRAINGVGDTIYVTWYDNRDGNWEIYFKRSTDGGSIWGTDIRLTNDTSTSWAPSLAVDGRGSIHVVWYALGGNCFHKRSTDAGITWSGEFRLGAGAVPGVSASGDTVYAVWHDINQFRPYLKSSTDGGVNWSDSINLAGDSVEGTDVAIVSKGPDVYAAWTKNQRLYFRHKRGSWGPVQNTTGQAHVFSQPAITASDSGVVHLVWEDDRNRPAYPQIFYKQSSDYGSIWLPDTQVSFGGEFSYSPSISARGQYLHLARVDYYPDSMAEYMYYRRSTDEGTSWESDTCLTPSRRFGPQSPSVCSYNNDVHLVWSDVRAGAWNLYYKKGTGISGISLSDQKFNNGLWSHHIIATPIPTKGQTRISLIGFPPSQEGVLLIYDITGRLVRRLGPFVIQNQKTAVIWDGDDENGRPVVTGIYPITLKLRGQNRAAPGIFSKIVVLR